MILKNRFTLKRVSLILFDLYNDKVILLDSDDEKVTLSVTQFHHEYEYVWMPSK